MRQKFSTPVRALAAVAAAWILGASSALAADVEVKNPVPTTYTVVRGDTLSGIGKKFGVNWRDIAALNGIANPDLIHPGQVFRIPS